MSSSLRRGALAAVLALSIVPLAACGAGNNAQTLQVKPDNAATTVGDIQIQNAVVLTQSGTGDSVVSAAVFNNGDARQTIETVTVGSGGTAELSEKDGGQTIVVPAHGSVLLGGKGNASVSVSGTAEGKRDGDYQTITFDFSDTGAVTVQALVRPATGYFESFGPTAKASPSESPSASPSGSASGSASSSASASESATG